ncbi:MAG: TlpA disulfide reductase family protein [Planctomycetota bacterium]
MLASLVLAALPQYPMSSEHWRAALATPGGALEFGLELWTIDLGQQLAVLINGGERIDVPVARWDERTLLLELPHYDSRITAELVEGKYVGTWEKQRGPAKRAQLAFTAQREPAQVAARPVAHAPRFGGRWAVDFATDDTPAVAEFVELPMARELTGTFLTTTGDYRYLAGRRGEELTLSCFDGAHAFLFKAKLQPDGTLAGDFWSGDWHHETWTAQRDDAAALPDAFEAVKWDGKTRLADLAFPDLEGKVTKLSDVAGAATLLVVFGSWCPNCHDEAKVLAELDKKYRARGLSIVGLAFELTGERARDAEQVRIFAEKYGLTYPFLLAGTADKEEATKALKMLDRVRAFPTTIFVGADGTPRAVHSGFAGPATGDEHLKLVREFEQRIEALLR